MLDVQSGTPPNPLSTGHGPRPTARASWAAALCALLVAVSGVAGLLTTLRAPPPVVPRAPQAPRALDRYDAGEPLTDRLAIVFLPRLDEQGLAAFAAALGREGPAGAGETAAFTVARPNYTAFEGVSLLLLAGNSAETTGTAATQPPTEPPDNLVRSLRAEGRGVLLFGPPAWRELFGEAAPPPGTPVAKPAATLAEAGAALRRTDAPLVAAYLPELGARDLAGDVQGEVAALGAALGGRDAVLLVGGGGGATEPLHLALSGPAVKPGRARRIDLNDIAPTAAVLTGARYPTAARGRVAWSLLAVDERRKATAALALARQRTTLAAGALPLGTEYPPLLQRALYRLPAVETALQEGQFAYAYQLASSSIDEADRALAATATTAPILPPRRVAWPLVAAGLGAALLAALLAALNRSALALGAATIGALAAAGSWSLLTALLRPLLVPALPTVAALLLLPAVLGGVLGAWLGRGTRRPPGRSLARRGLAVELLVLLAGLPIALCAYRYGLPWQLRWEEAAPLFRWRSALLAPTMLLVAGSAWLLLFPRLARLFRGRWVVGGGP